MIVTASLLLILMYSIILHEISHGYAALLNGDTTAKDRGRLTLNPLPHVDPVGTVILPLLLVLVHAPFFIGWAKPVPFDPRYFRRFKSGVFTVALAGPLTNIALACAFAAALRNFHSDQTVSQILLYGASLNVMLALFNLVPIPPLDGSRAIGIFLPPPMRRAYFSIERFGLVILAALMYLGFFQHFLLPAYERALGFLFS